MAGALALSGTVVDALGIPVEGAESCLISGGQPVLCVPTDANGFWRLTDTAAESIRITKSGFLPATLAPTTPPAPIVLERAAALRVRVVDPQGNPVGSGTLTLVYASGRKIGPLPFNRAGMLHPSLPPGAVRVTAEADGWSLPAPVAVTLEAGREREAVVRMTRR
jgi:hypothetical protein